MRLSWLLFVLVLSGTAQAAGPSWHRPVWHRSVAFDAQVAADYTTIQTETWDITADTNTIAQTVAEQTFSYLADLEQVTIVEAYTRKRDGRVIPVGADAVFRKAVATYAAAPQFSDETVRTIVFPQVGAGDTVHYVLRRVGRVSMFPGQFTAAFEAGVAATTDDAVITIRLPRNEALQTDVSGLEELPPRVGADGGVTHTWRRAPEAEGRIGLDASTIPDYATLGRLYAEDAFRASVPDAAVRALADRLAPDGLAAREMVARLTRYVAQETRYVALFLGNGRVVPRDAAAVLATGWGDCKDHAALLQALLTAKGIASVPALISLQNRFDLPSAPGLAALDHVITYIPSLDLFVDSTSPYAPAGLLPASEYDKPVILADPANARVIRTPPMPDPGLALDSRTTARIAPDGAVSGRTETRATGPEAIGLRSMAAWIERNGPGYAAASQLERLGTPGIARYDFASPDAEPGDYDVVGHFTLDDALPDAGGEPFPLPVGLPVFGRPGTLLLGEASGDGGTVCYPGSETEELSLSLPPGTRLRDRPENLDVTAGNAHYVARYVELDGILHVHREFTLHTLHQRCGADEIAALRPALAAARHDRTAQISLLRPDPGHPDANRLAGTP